MNLGLGMDYFTAQNIQGYLDGTLILGSTQVYLRLQQHHTVLLPSSLRRCQQPGLETPGDDPSSWLNMGVWGLRVWGLGIWV